jgi:hypothetical protein
VTNRLDDVLAAIDAETAKCICGRPVPADGPSLDYCSLPCQYRWTANLVGSEPASDTVYDAADEITSGREIVQQFARELAQPAPYGAAEFHSCDSMRQRAEPERTEPADGSAVQARPLSPVTSGLADMVRTTMSIPAEWANWRLALADPEWIPTEAEHDRAETALAAETSQPIGLRYTIGGITYHGTGHAVRLPDGSFRVRGSFDPRAEPREQPAAPPQLVEDESNGTTRIMWVPEIADPNAPTASELAAGVTIGVLDESPALLTPEALEQALREARGAYYLGYREAPSVEPEPTLTGDEIRARALESRQNRGTGPARRDNRRWRNR